MIYTYKSWIILLTLMAITAFTDIKEKKIPNLIVFPGMAVGLFVSFNGWKDTLFKICGMTIIFFIGMLGAAGFGDIKLWMMTIAFIGFENSLWCVGIAAVLIIIYGIIFKKSDTLKELTYKKEIKKSNIYPFAPFVLIGTTCVFIWRVLNV